MPEVPEKDDWVVAGKVGAPHGIKGWVRVISYTQPIDNLTEYQPWQLEMGGIRQDLEVVHHQVHGDVILVGFAGVNDRDAAAKLTHALILIDQKCLPAAAAGEYYWHDLQGLEVKNLEGFVFGHITRMMSTGANDVMFVKGEKEYCLPYVSGVVVKNVDLKAQQILVDWPEEIE
jgi:16S rRNA processing protein RimM